MSLAILVLSLLQMGLSTLVTLAPAEPPELRKAIGLFDAGERDAAKAALTPFATGPKPHASAQYYLGRLALDADDTQQAARWFAGAVRLEDTNASYHLWLGRAYGTEARRAGKLSQLGLAKKTKAEFERASALDPNNLDAREDLISYYLMAPGFMGGSVEKARGEALEIRKRDVLRGALSAARVAEDQKDLATAERELRVAVEQFPDSLGARIALGLFFVRAERYDYAFAAFEAALERHPGDPATLYQIGRTAAVSGARLDRGEVALRQFIAGELPDRRQRLAAGHLRLGNVLEKSGRKAEAREAYQRSLALQPSMKEAKQALAKLK